MKNFVRDNQLFSLCGLNCGLCTMHLGKLCPGCGGGEGNQGCKIARCSIAHDKVQYCNQCEKYPCDKYEGIDQFDSFITHKNQKADLEKMKEIGVEAYNDEQNEKIKILKMLLEKYNDGRKKTFFCVAVNLLALSDLRTLLKQIQVYKEKKGKVMPNDVVTLFNQMARERKIELKLRRKR